MHPFDEAIALDPVGADLMRGRTHPGWSNMVGPFGGITAAVLMRAVEAHPERIGEPLALTVNFAAAIADGEFDIAVRPGLHCSPYVHQALGTAPDGLVRVSPGPFSTEAHIDHLLGALGEITGGV